MKIARSNRLTQAAFTLVEAIICVAIGAIAFLSLYMGFSGGFAIIQAARENLRATQIMVEKMETIRLYTWHQVAVQTNYVPKTFKEPYNPIGGSGFMFEGTMTISPVPFNVSYSNDVRLVTVDLTWKSGNGKIERERRMSTLVTRNGLQNYIY